MILYHGSFLEIPHPDLNHSRSNVDFWARILYHSDPGTGRKMVWKI